MMVNCDSQSTLYLVKISVFHFQVKHINIRYHFIRDVIDDDLIMLLKIHININPVNMLIKMMTRGKLNQNKISLNFKVTREVKASKTLRLHIFR